MIASLSGTLRVKAPDEIVVECGGVGYGLIVPMSTYGALPEVGASVALLVYTHVREDALQLFGFGTAIEKQLFQRLIGISGIGPRLACAAMSGMSPSDVVAAIQRGDSKRLTLVPGIGRKTAERIVLELQDKVMDLAAAPASGARPSRLAARHPVQDDVISALVNLGYRAQAADDAVAKATADGVGGFEEVLRASLRLLQPGG